VRNEEPEPRGGDFPSLSSLEGEHHDGLGHIFITLNFIAESSDNGTDFDYHISYASAHGQGFKPMPERVGLMHDAMTRESQNGTTIWMEGARS
jgi:hypothetical protein